MILKYVLKNFTRRKVRTILMILSLMVSTGLIVTMSATVETVRQSIVDLIANEIGRADLVVRKKDTSRDLYIPIADVSADILSSDDRIAAVHPRIEINVETQIDGERGEIYMIGLISATDNVVPVTVHAGEYELGNGKVAVDQLIAGKVGLELGDTFTAAFAFPIPREVGKPAASGTSSVRLQRVFTVGAIVSADGMGSSKGILAELADIQSWLDRSEQANQLAVVIDPKIYETNNSNAAALSVRSIARAVQDELGPTYDYRMDLAATLSEASQVFLALQALINTYGLISLGVVGLLVYTLVMTNVQEQRRDMAVLRILGSPRQLLFRIVIVEVVVIGLIGVGLGVILGQLLTTYALVPLLTYFFEQEGLIIKLVPQVSVATLLLPVISAFTVLIVSSLKPANSASRTKVMHAINPGVADNIQLEDLAQLRQRRPDGKMFFTGLAMSLVFILVTGFDALGNFGGEVLQIIFAMLGLMGMVLGLSLMFFITTIPFERLVLAVMRVIAPRLTYFAGRNVSRGKTRNTLIALLVLFSAVLPSFLGTQAQLELANNENRAKMRMGAPARIQSKSAWWGGGEALKPSFVQYELATLPGLDQVVGLTYAYDSRAQDNVGMRSARITIRGLEGDFSQVAITEMVEFTAGGPKSLQTILQESDSVIISEGLADHLEIGLGEKVNLRGEGLDHLEAARVVGIVRRLPGIDGITRSKIAARNESTVLVSLAHFGRLVTALDQSQPGPEAPMIETVYASFTPEADATEIGDLIRERYSEKYGLWVDLLEWRLNEDKGDMMFFVGMLLALTAISFTTAVFAVFAVIYVTIYARRIEIGMLKSMGMLRRQLTGMLIVEAIAMTLGSALAGIAAGASMGYLNYYINAALEQMPALFAIDKIVMPAIIIMVVLASILAAAFSARRIVRKQAVEILRMS
jgi:ABC-type antimicrobial peptide transport system permease subunit